jgi:hypothetical protein
MDHTSRFEFDDEKGKERTKEEIRDLQEVASPNLCCVMVQKGRPSLSSCWWCTNLPHVLLDGSLADMHTQFQQFAADPLSAPQSIFSLCRLLGTSVLKTREEDDIFKLDSSITYRKLIVKYGKELSQNPV